MTDRKEVDQRFQKMSMSSDLVANGRETLQEFFGKTDIGLLVIPDSFRGAIGGMVMGR